MRRRFGWLAIPFVYGDINDEVLTDNDTYVESWQGGRRSQPVYNGAVASINFFFLMTTFLFAICLAPVLGSKQNTNVYVEIILIIFMITGVIVKLLFVTFRHRNAVFHGPKLFKGVDRIVYAIGLIIFYLSGCFSDLFHVIAKVTCDQVWRSCDHEIYKAYAIDVMFYLTKIIYLGGSVLFTLVFYSSKFLKSCLVRYGLMFLLSTYLTIWFDLFVHQSHHLMETKQERRQSRNLTTYYCFTINSSSVPEVPSNVSLQWQCITRATSFDKMLKHYVTPICFRIACQAFILIIERFLHWLPGSGDDSHVTSSSWVKNVHEITQPMIINQVTGVLDDVAGDDEEDNSENGNESSILEETGDYGTDLSANRRSIHVLMVMVSVATITINVPALLVLMVPLINDKSSSSSYSLAVDNYYNIEQISTIFCLFVMIIVVSIGYRVASSFRILRSKPFTMLDYLIVISLFGNSGRTMLSLFYFLTISGSPSRAIDILCRVTIIFQSYYQLPFCFFAIRVIARGENDSRFRIRSMLFKAVLIHLAVCNAMLWFINILNGVKYDLFHLTLGPNERNAWQFVDRFLQPMTLFYRFGCFLLVAKALRKAFSETRITTNSDIVDMST